MRLSLYDDPRLKSLKYRPGQNLVLTKPFEISYEENQNWMATIHPQVIKPGTIITIEQLAIFADNTLGYYINKEHGFKFSGEEIDTWIINTDILEEYFTLANSSIIRTSCLNLEDI